LATRTRIGEPIAARSPSADLTPGFLRPDGGAIAVTDGRGVAVWDLDPERLAEAARALAGRNLTPSEWYSSVCGLWEYRATRAEPRGAPGEPPIPVAYPAGAPGDTATSDAPPVDLPPVGGDEETRRSTMTSTSNTVRRGADTIGRDIGRSARPMIRALSRGRRADRKSTRLNSSHVKISY